MNICWTLKIEKKVHLYYPNSVKYNVTKKFKKSMIFTWKIMLISSFGLYLHAMFGYILFNVCLVTVLYHLIFRNLFTLLSSSFHNSVLPSKYCCNNLGFQWMDWLQTAIKGFFNVLDYPVGSRTDFKFGVRLYRSGAYVVSNFGWCHISVSGGIPSMTIFFSDTSLRSAINHNCYMYYKKNLSFKWY